MNEAKQVFDKAAAARMSEKGKRALLAAFDAIADVEICDPTGHGKGQSMACAMCGALNGDKHKDSCPVGVAMAAIGSLVPAFYDREKWIGEQA